jgi:hypothetical protein
VGIWAYLKWRIAGETEVVEVRGQHFPQLREGYTAAPPPHPDNRWQWYVCLDPCPWESRRTMDIPRDRREMQEEADAHGRPETRRVKRPRSQT